MIMIQQLLGQIINITNSIPTNACNLLTILDLQKLMS